MLASPCGRCALTWTAAELLERVASHLERSRGDDGSWFVERCPVCDRVTAVVDASDGSVFGDVDAAASLGDVVDLQPRLVRGDEIAPIPRRHDGRRRRRSHGWLALPIAGLVVLLIAAASFAAVYAIARSPRMQTIVDRVAGPEPVAVHATPLGPTGSTTPLDGVAGSTPRGIGIGRVDAIVAADDVEAVARIRNASDVELPPTDVTFSVVGAGGEVLATTTTIVDLAVGETKTVGADAFTLLTTDRPAAVRVSIAREPAHASAASVHVSIADVALATIGDRAAVRGVVANVGRDDATVTVSCAVRDANDALTHVAVDSLDIAAFEERAFAIWLPAGDGSEGAAACAAS